MVRDSWKGANKDTTRNYFCKNLSTATEQKKSIESIPQSPEVMIQEEFESFIDINVGQEYTGDQNKK